MPEPTIQQFIETDRLRIRNFITQRWGTEFVVAHGVVYHPHELPGFVAMRDNQIAGLLTYHIADDECEIVTIDSIQAGIGIGTTLIDTVKQHARQIGCKRIWLVTTNDNLNALRFYQKRGFTLVAVHRNAIEVSRKIKPQIPLVGENGILLRDEIELEMELR